MAATNHPEQTPGGADPRPDRAAEASPDVQPGEDTLGETQFMFNETSSRASSGSRQASIDAWVGRRMGRYEIRGVLGIGGMGVVYRGYDELIDREVAIKMLPEEVSENSVNLQRFLSEAKAVGKLNHPNTVAIYEVGQEGNHYYLVMEFVTGGSVADQMERVGALSVYDATRVTADACRGLAAANAAGMVHRDIKPANLLYAHDGNVKIADFGLAKRALDQSRQVTQDGKIVGTPYFMSPEQCESNPIDHRSDIYSLGATYYCMLTGINPYDNMGSVVQVMYAHCNGSIPDPRVINSRIPVACSHIVAQCHGQAPEDRYQHPTEMLADLEALSATISGANVTLPSLSGTHAQVSPSGPSQGYTALGSKSMRSPDGRRVRRRWSWPRLRCSSSLAARPVIRQPFLQPALPAQRLPRRSFPRANPSVSASCIRPVAAWPKASRR